MCVGLLIWNGVCLWSLSKSNPTVSMLDLQCRSWNRCLLVELSGLRGQQAMCCGLHTPIPNPIWSMCADVPVYAIYIRWVMRERVSVWYLSERLEPVFDKHLCLFVLRDCWPADCLRRKLPVHVQRKALRQRLHRIRSERFLCELVCIWSI